MQLSQFAKIVRCDLNGPDVSFNQVSIDSRTIEAGQLFFALRGENFDGHRFIDQAIKKGAAGLVVETPVHGIDIPYVLVEDARKALGSYAHYHRQQMSARIIAVTGSSGKTTTKGLLASVFRQLGVTRASESSFNNDVGVPLTLLGLTEEDRYLIAEIGANHLGEIDYLTKLVEPDVAIITNVAPAHLEGFGSLEAIAREKGSIYGGLPANGYAVINNDDHFASFWRELAQDTNILTFGVDQPADVFAEDVFLNDKSQALFKLYLPDGGFSVQLQLLGYHNVYNALAAAAAGYVLGLSHEHIKQGLEKGQAASKRLNEYHGYAGATVIDDSYNANPGSVAAALRLLAQRAKGNGIVVLGDMRELGPTAADLHRQIGLLARDLGIKQLYGFGDFSQYTVEAFGKNGVHFKDKQALISDLKSKLTDATTVLVKGSRSMKMEEITQALLDKVHA